MFTAVRIPSGTPGDATAWRSCATALDAGGVDALIVGEPAVAADAPARFDPLTAATLAASVTGRLAVVASETAVHGFPYHVARRLATFDHVAGGRGGWLARTADTDAERGAFEFHAVDAADEPARAAEFLDVVLGLWDTWEPGAQAGDAAGGDFHDDARIHALGYASERFLVAGPLDTPRTPQGRPAVVVDVVSDADVALAARFADVAVLDAAAAGRLVPAIRAAAGDAVVRTVVALPVGDTDPGDVVATVAAAGADGVVLVASSLDAAASVVDTYLPALGSVAAAGTLIDRLGLTGSARHGRRAA